MRRRQPPGEVGRGKPEYALVATLIGSTWPSQTSPSTRARVLRSIVSVGSDVKSVPYLATRTPCLTPSGVWMLIFVSHACPLSKWTWAQLRRLPLHQPQYCLRVPTRSPPHEAKMPALLTRCGVPHPAGESLALADETPVTMLAATAVATAAARIRVRIVISTSSR